MKYQLCPVCLGRGNVPVGFYNPYQSVTSTTVPETCKTCEGKGIILKPSWEWAKTTGENK